VTTPHKIFTNCGNFCPLVFASQLYMMIFLRMTRGSVTGTIPRSPFLIGMRLSRNPGKRYRTQWEHWYTFLSGFYALFWSLAKKILFRRFFMQKNTNKCLRLLLLSYLTLTRSVWSQHLYTLWNFYLSTIFFLQNVNIFYILKVRVNHALIVTSFCYRQESLVDQIIGGQSLLKKWP